MHVTERFDIVIIGSGAGGGTMAQALSSSAGADPDPRAWRLRSAGGRELGSGSGLEAASLPREGALARRARPRVQPVHALLRRRQHQVLGQRALSAAARGFPGGRARRRRLAGVADRLRHARAVLRAGRTALPRARTARRRSDRAAARTVSVRAGSALARNGGDRRAARGARDSIRRRCRSACCEPGEAGRLHPLQHVQLVPVQAPREERSGRLLHPPGDPAAERHAVDERLRAASDHRLRRAGGRGGRSRAERRDAPRRRRRCSSCRAAPSTRRRCCCARRTPRIPTAWRTRRDSSGAATWRTWRP